MEKLKTLKDLEVFEDNNPMWNAANKHFEQVIKAEAIKWVKDCKCESKVYNVDDKLSFINYCDGCERMIEFINITSEDLK